MKLAYRLLPERCPLGLIVLQSDLTIEGDMRRLLPPGLDLLTARVPSGAHVTPETLAAMQDHLSAAAGRFPSGQHFRVIGYGCTSGTAEIGADTVAARISKTADVSHVTDPLSALIAACASLGASRLGIVSPYRQDVSARLVSRLDAAGIHVNAFASFQESAEEKVARIAPDAVISGADTLIQGARQPLDALFLSCTNLQTLDVITPLEERIGIPVLSSNQVLAWHMLQLAGLANSVSAPGVLWRHTAIST